MVTEDGSFNTPPAIYFRPSDVSADWVGTAGSFALSSGFTYGTVYGITNAGATGPVPALVSVVVSPVVPGLLTLPTADLLTQGQPLASATLSGGNSGIGSGIRINGSTPAPPTTTIHSCDATANRANATA